MSYRATEPEGQIRTQATLLEETYSSEYARWERTIDAERARSAKLIEALRKYEHMVWQHRMDGPVWAARDAIAEYEATRD